MKQGVSMDNISILVRNIFRSIFILETMVVKERAPTVNGGLKSIFRQLVAVVTRRHAGKMLEVFPEKRLVGEVQRQTYFLDVHTCASEHEFCFEDHTVINPFSCGLSADIFKYSRKMLWSYKKFVGVEIDRAF